MDRHPIPQPIPEVVPALEGGDDLGGRRCGRCRRVFEDDPALDIQGTQDWSRCRPCQAILFPRRTRSSARLTLVPPLEEGS